MKLFTSFEVVQQCPIFTPQFYLCVKNCRHTKSWEDGGGGGGEVHKFLKTYLPIKTSPKTCPPT